jgi:hypothetical protein
MQISARHHLCVITPLLFSSVSLKLEAVVFQQALALEVIYFLYLSQSAVTYSDRPGILSQRDSALKAMYIFMSNFGQDRHSP